MSELLSESAEHQIANNLLTELKEGKYDQVDRELNAIPLADRMKIAKEMQSTADADKDNKNYPDLKITTSTDAGGTEHLTGLKVQGHWTGKANSFWSHDAFHEKADGSFVPRKVANAADTQMDEALKQIYTQAITALKGDGLTPAQEVELAKAVEEGLKARHEGKPIPEDTDTQKAVKKALDAQSGSL